MTTATAITMPSACAEPFEDLRGELFDAAQLAFIREHFRPVIISGIGHYEFCMSIEDFSDLQEQAAARAEGRLAGVVASVQAESAERAAA